MEWDAFRQLKYDQSRLSDFENLSLICILGFWSAEWTSSLHFGLNKIYQQHVQVLPRGGAPRWSRNDFFKPALVHRKPSSSSIHTVYMHALSSCFCFRTYIKLQVCTFYVHSWICRKAPGTTYVKYVQSSCILYIFEFSFRDESWGVNSIPHRRYAPCLVFTQRMETWCDIPAEFRIHQSGWISTLNHSPRM